MWEASPDADNGVLAAAAISTASASGDASHRRLEQRDGPDSPSRGP
ncbi:hypothetical protein MalM25_33480 [Planctomycetes bacterium MalM25]|nr:hypothetical protein MalM25_33480 [Planctomycetes bacterium MalM25]